MDNVKIVQREVAYVVFTREMGDYEKSSKIAWERLSAAMDNLEKKFAQRLPKTAMCLGRGNGEALGICHDNPEVTEEAKLRYDAALAWDKKDVEELANYDFETKSVAGGKYAMVEYMGGMEAADRAWYGLYAWIEKNGYTFRDEPAFEKYINACNETDPTKIQTEVYVPIV